jgi:DNA helicase HerA-like ATPase
MPDAGAIFLGKGGDISQLLLSVANRHGMIAGATGTGKTATLRVLAEGFSKAGVPVFAADIKGDLSGLSSRRGQGLDRQALQKIDMKSTSPTSFPSCSGTCSGNRAIRCRTTISEMGPLLLARMMNLNDTQEGVLNIAFRVADENGLLLVDLKDLRAILAYVAENSAKYLMKTYGNVASTTVGAIQRQLADARKPERREVSSANPHSTSRI